MATLFQSDLAGKLHSLSIANRHFYILQDGQLLPIRVWPAWCRRCQAFVAAEKILAIADEENELAEVEYFAERPGLIPPDRYIPCRQLPELRLRRAWRETRRSPEKCLDCGSIEIHSIWPGQELDIPGHGKCVANFRGWTDRSGPPDAYYSPEGDRIR